MLFGHEKEGYIAICDNMDGLEGNMLSEIKQRKTNTKWYHSYVESKKQTN